MTGREERQFIALDASIYCEFEVGEWKCRSEVVCGDVINIWIQGDDGEWLCETAITNYSLKGSPDAHELGALTAAAFIRNDARMQEKEWA
jgi:hypothetical protein